MQIRTTPEWADEKYITHHFGITHTPLYRLRKTQAIRSVSMKESGMRHGKRLYHVPSIVDYLAEREQAERSLGHV